MPSVSLKPKSQTLGLLIALTILCAVGFLILYFKLDLESSLAAGDHALISKDIAELKMQINQLRAQ